MTNFDVAYLRSQNITPLLTSGINGDHAPPGPKLYYMPHCPEELYAAVLSANAGSLADVAILGNPLSKYVDRLRSPAAPPCPPVLLAAARDPRYEELPLPLLSPPAFRGGGWEVDPDATEDGRGAAEAVYRGLHGLAVMRWGGRAPASR
jgi:hypothetical protein